MAVRTINEGWGSGSDIIIDESTVGKGAIPVAGDNITISYTAKLKDGTEFDSNLSCTFTINFQESPMQGLDYALLTMTKGTTATITIPPSLGWPHGNGPVDANSDTLWDVEFLKIN